MNTENTIFHNIEKPEYNKIWQSTKHFKHLTENIGAINTELQSIGIQRVASLDQIGTSIETMQEDHMTLLILPQTENQEEQSKKTLATLKKLKIEVTEELNVIDILPDKEDRIDSRLLTYYTLKNIIITHINPFYNSRVYEEIIKDIKAVKPKQTTAEERSIKQFTKLLESGIKNRLNILEQEYQDLDMKINEMRTTFKEKIQKIITTEREIEALKNTGTDYTEIVNSEIKEVKKLPFIKGITFNNTTMNVNIGKVYLKGIIKDGMEEKDGVKQVKTKTETVYIGDMTVHINNEEIIVSTKERGIEKCHPHAGSDGKPCFGEAELMIMMLHKKFKIAELLKILYSWAFSYNKDDNNRPFRDLQEYIPKGDSA